MRINQEIEEKPNHLHYPACLGRMNEINKQSVDIFIYTAIVCFAMGVLSLVGLKYNIFAVIPDLLFDENGTKVAFFQIFEFLVMTVISLLGCTRYKIFDVIIMLIYALMILISIFFRDSAADPLVLMAGIGGIWKSHGSFSIYNDYEQLKQTEGFPVFSLILTEHDEKMQNSASQNALDNTLSKVDPSSALGQSVMQAVTSMNNTSMPSVSNITVPEVKTALSRYMPQGDKESGIIESPMKFNI